MPFYPFSAWICCPCVNLQHRGLWVPGWNLYVYCNSQFCKIVMAVKCVLCYSLAINNVSRVKTSVCGNESGLTSTQKWSCSPKISAQLSLLGLSGHFRLLSINKLGVNTREGEELSGAGANGDKLAVATLLYQLEEGFKLAKVSSYKGWSKTLNFFLRLTLGSCEGIGRQTIGLIDLQKAFSVP